MNTDEKILQETLRVLFEGWDRSDKQKQSFANAQNLAKVEDFALQLVKKVAPNTLNEMTSLDVQDYILKSYKRLGYELPKTVYRYYSTQRPVNIHTYPSRMNVLNIKNYDNRLSVEGLKAWGYIEFDAPLTDDEKLDYDLYVNGEDEERVTLPF